MTLTKQIGMALVALGFTSTASADLNSATAQLWHQGSAGIGIPPEPDARVGGAVAAGDFNCDGYDDAAIGMHLANLNSAIDAGRVLVIYSTAVGSGLNAAGRQTLSQAGTGLPSDEASGEHFGRALAAGDFNGDGCGDLAIGVPNDDIGTASDAGAVHVLYGTATGLSLDADDYLRQGVAGVAGAPSTGDHFGSALTAGDFNADGYADLAVGAPGEDLGSGASAKSNAGVVHVAYGSFFGLDVVPGTLLARGTGLPGTPVAGEAVGSELAAGEVDSLLAGDELVIGVPSYDPTPALANAGGVFLVRDVDGIPNAALIEQDTPNVPGGSEAGDLFGSAVAVGDFDADGLGEIAIGSSGEGQNAPYIAAIGALTVLEWQSGTSQSFVQGQLTPETPESGDAFAASLAAGDFDGDGSDDLAIGVALEDVEPRVNAGIVHVLYGGSLTGLRLSGRQILYQQVDTTGANDRFGDALAVGRFDSGSGMDLMVGSPYNSITVSQTGSVNVFYSAD